MKEIIEMGKEGKVFSLSAVADLLYGGIEVCTSHIDWDRKDISRKFLWKANDFSSIAKEDREFLIKSMVETGKTDVLVTRIECFLHKKILLPHLSTLFDCKYSGSPALLPLEIIRWHQQGVPAAAGERATLKKLLLKAQKENKSLMTKILLNWLSALAKK